MRLTRRSVLFAAAIPVVTKVLADKRSREPARISEALATHAIETPLRAIDSAALRATKLRVLDVLGYALAGTRAEGNAALAEIVAKPNQAGDATVIGFGTRANLADVAMAVAIAARLRKLTPRQTLDAMGLAVDQIGGTIQSIWDGAMDFKLPQGAVARNAILAVDLASRGWTGTGDPLLASYGFYQQYTAGCARPDVLTAELGKIFHGEYVFQVANAMMRGRLRPEHYFEPNIRNASLLALIERTADSARAAQIEERVQNLEKEPDMSQFVALLRAA